MAEGVFIRKASGLTRVIGPWDALAFAFMNPGIMYCFLYLIWTHQLYPGVSMPIAVIVGVVLMFPPALTYIWLSMAMPRSGGEYIWGSRTISAAWGFCASWGLTLVGLSWAGALDYWSISFGFNQALRALAVSQSGSLFATNSLWVTAEFIDSLPVMIVLGTLVMLSFMMIVWRGARAAMILSWIGVITGTLGHLAFDVGVLTGGGLPAFIERWNAMSGTTYQAVLDAANAGGWNTGYVSMTVSLGAGITYVALNTLGSTYTANIMGEIKEVRKSAILAMLGALVLFLIYWEVFYSVAYYGFGRDFWAAMAYFAPAGAGAGTWEGWPFRAYSFIPMPQFLLVYLNPNVAYSVVCSVCFGICTYASCMGLAFGTVRNLFAYSFDRVLPTFFSKTDKRGSPWSAVLLGAIIVWIFFIIMVYAAMWVAYSILAWFFAWAIVGIVGMVFPYSKRGKAIFEKSPELVKKKIGGVPILFIFGLLTFIISVAIDYFMLVPFFQGLIDATFIWMTVFMFIIPAFVIYYISRAYHKAKGVPMELQFREVPPD